jgi:hypothetical protein
MQGVLINLQLVWRQERGRAAPHAAGITTAGEVVSTIVSWLPASAGRWLAAGHFHCRLKAEATRSGGSHASLLTRMIKKPSTPKIQLPTSKTQAVCCNALHLGSWDLRVGHCHGTFFTHLLVPNSPLTPTLSPVSTP